MLREYRDALFLVMVVILVPIILTAVSLRHFQTDCDSTGGHFSMTLTSADCHY